MATLVNPYTKEEVQVDPVWQGPQKMNQLLGEKWVPKSQKDMDTINTYRKNTKTPPIENMKTYEQQLQEAGGNPYLTGIQQAKEAASNIMEGYRPFGQDNPYLSQAYGTDNPYLSSVMENIQGLETMSKDANPSIYAKSLLDQQGLINKMKQEELIRGQSSDTATAFSNLAQQGGLNSGARERLYTMGNKSLMEGRQGLAQQDALARGGILSNDIQFKQDLATKIPGMYNPYAVGAEDWRQKKALGQETYNQERESQRFATIGNIYGGGTK